MERKDIMKVIIAVATVLFATFVLIVFTGVYTDIIAWWEYNKVFFAIIGLSIICAFSNVRFVDEEDYIYEEETV